MPRKRTIDEIPTRYCELEACDNAIPKQKPCGKWKTPTQYREQKSCSDECRKALRTQPKAGQQKTKKHRSIKISLNAMDIFLQKKL